MKILASIIILISSVITFVVLDHTDDPACDKSNFPPNAVIGSCCPLLPHFNDLEILHSCKAYCSIWISNPNQPGAKKCCILNCTLTKAGVMTKNETFNTDVMANYYKKTVVPSNANIWYPVIEKAINECFDTGIKYSSSVVSEEMEPQCETENITLALNITKCIRRELFFGCKDESMRSENCQALKDFGMACIHWPWQCYPRRRHSDITKY